MSTPAVTWRMACSQVSTNAAHGNAVAAGPVQHGGGRYTERIGDQAAGMAEGDLHQLFAGLVLVGRRPVKVLAVVGALSWIDVVPAKQIVDEGAMAGGNLYGQVALRRTGVCSD